MRRIITHETDTTGLLRRVSGYPGERGSAERSSAEQYPANRFLGNQGESVVCRKESYPKVAEFGHGALAIFGFQSCNRILHDGDAAAAIQQSFGGKADTVFRNHAEDDELDVVAESFHELVSMPACKNIEGLLFEENLLIRRKILGHYCGGIVRHDNDFVRQSLGNERRTLRAFDAMRGKRLEFRIVFCVVATVRNQEYAPLAGSVCQLANVGSKRSAPGT